MKSYTNNTPNHIGFCDNIFRFVVLNYKTQYHMKNLYALLLSILIPIAGFSQFETPNENTNYTLDDLTTLNDTVVTFEDGIYYINHPLIIAVTDTLTINEDSEVRIAEEALITIKGGFLVNSTTLFTKIDNDY